MNTRTTGGLRRWLIRLELGGLALALAFMASYAPGTSGAAQAQSAAEGSVTPSSGGGGTRFVFSAGGFLGDPDDGEDDTANSAERVAFWINTPNGGTIRATRDGADADSASAPTTTRASRAGSVTWEWRAPADIAPGRYTLVAHGLTSERNVVIAFEVIVGSRGMILDAPASASPPIGAAGTVFSFTAAGFTGDADDGDEDRSNDAEKVVFWINNPDGSVTQGSRADVEDDASNAHEVRADRSGQVTVRWAAPADATPGVYTMVIFGLESERVQVIQFELR